MILRYLIFLSIFLLASCGNTISVDSQTLYPYQYHEQYADKSQLKKLVIATVNYGQESPSYLRYEEKTVDLAVTDYLEQHGYMVLTGNQFDTAWSAAIDTYGEYYDPYSATFRRDRFNQILSDTLDSLKQKHGVDAILFTDLLVRKVNFTYKQPHYASWDGVKRKPRLKGGNGVPRDYNWAKTFRASSVSITIFRWDKQFVFNGVGGIEMIDNLNMKTGTPKATRHTNLFDDEKMINEGLQLAMHPFIPMENYPGN